MHTSRLQQRHSAPRSLTGLIAGAEAAARTAENADHASAIRLAAAHEVETFSARYRGTEFEPVAAAIPTTTVSGRGRLLVLMGLTTSVLAMALALGALST